MLWHSRLRICATARKTRIHFLMGVSGIFHWLTVTSHTVALGSFHPHMEMTKMGILRGKGGRCIGLAIWPPSFTDCIEILAASTAWIPKGLYRDSFFKRGISTCDLTRTQSLVKSLVSCSADNLLGYLAMQVSLPVLKCNIPHNQNFNEFKWILSIKLTDRSAFSVLVVCRNATTHWNTTSFLHLCNDCTTQCATNL